MDAHRKRVAVLAPPPLAGSGGHRTIFRNLEALAEAGFRVEVHVEGRRLRPSRWSTALTRKYFDVPGMIALTPGWPGSIEGVDLVLATTWQSALHLGKVETPGIKAHFVQDYECLFYPEDDERYALARSVHDLDFASITIGNWLVEVLSREHGIEAWPTPFTADLALYGADPESRSTRQRMVVANYQPEKPRRCPDLMKGALQRMLESDPSIEVVTFGSRRSPGLRGNHRHLGLVHPKALASLYRQAGVGLSMSATNPSRIPFEMMASGLPVVELGGENNRLDLPEAGCLLAEPDPAALSSAVIGILEDRDRAKALGRGGVTFMGARPLEEEAGAFVGACRRITGDQLG